MNVSWSNAPFSAARTDTMRNISGKKKFILILQVNVHRCIQSNLYVTALNKRSLYITVTGQLPKIFSCLPQQRVAVVHRFDYVTINKRFRYISWNIYPWCKRLFLRVRRWPDWSVSADLLHARNKTSGLVVQTDDSAPLDKSDKYWEKQLCYPLDRA